MKDVPLKIEVDEKNIQRIQDAKKLFSVIAEEVVIDASITTENKKDGDVVYKVRVVNLRFKDGTVLRVDEEGEFVLSTEFSLPTENEGAVLKGMVPSELFVQFRDVAEAFLDSVEEKINEFVNKVNIRVER